MYSIPLIGIIVQPVSLRLQELFSWIRNVKGLKSIPFPWQHKSKYIIETRFQEVSTAYENTVKSEWVALFRLLYAGNCQDSINTRTSMYPMALPIWQAAMGAFYVLTQLTWSDILARINGMFHTLYSFISIKIVEKIGVDNNYKEKWSTTKNSWGCLIHERHYFMIWAF